jgi:VanZ family protein
MKNAAHAPGGEKYIYMLLSLLFGGILLFISVLPHSTIEETPYPEISDLFDASMHFLGFCLFNFFLFSFLVRPIVRRRNSDGLGMSSIGRSIETRKIVAYFCIGVLWGLICESSQYFIPSRSFQLIDILANTLPSLLIYVVAKKLLLSGRAASE